TLTHQETLLILQEIQGLCKQNAQINRQKIHEQNLLRHSLQEMEIKMKNLNTLSEQLQQKITAASFTFQRNQKTSIWQRYWMAIAMGILASLITNLIWFLKIG